MLLASLYVLLDITKIILVGSILFVGLLWSAALLRSAFTDPYISAEARYKQKEDEFNRLYPKTKWTPEQLERIGKISNLVHDKFS